MSETKHTPGPWRYSSSDAYTHQVRSENGTLVCSFSQYSNGNSSYDAKLSAAAPELLEALELWWHESTGQMDKKSCGHDYTCTCVGQKTRAAIAKAKGEE